MSREQAGTQAFEFGARRRILPALLALAGLCSCGSGSAPRDPSKTQATSQSAPGASQATNENRFYSAVGGVSIEKLPSWSFMPLEFELQNREAVSVGKKETDAAMHDSTTPPLVVIARFPEPSDKPNPTLKINRRALGDLQGAAPVEITRQVVMVMANAVPSFQLDDEIREAEIGGFPAGAFRAHFTIEVPRLGRSFTVRTQGFIVPRGNYGLIIAASDPTDGAENYEADFQAMVKTIVIDK
ncbi:MAG TPA: hypothetical protein VNN72_17630 [Polyangiaceae bacterium]|nr:hypothetical protein [Polyangiaceae bacterium]